MWIFVFVGRLAVCAAVGHDGIVPEGGGGVNKTSLADGRANLTAEGVATYKKDKVYFYAATGNGVACATGVQRGELVVVDGDMMMPKSQFDSMFLKERVGRDSVGRRVRFLGHANKVGLDRRALMPGYKWDNAIVPYSFVQLERDLLIHGKTAHEIATYKSLLLDAMSEFSEASALVFREANVSTDPYVLEIVSGYTDNDKSSFVAGGGSWCWSFVGDVRMTTMFTDVYAGVTRMNLDAFDNYGQCWNKPTLIHELGHAVGMYHEQQRTDRDTYIVVDACGLAHNNEIQHASDSGDITYDFRSIMHYTMAGIGTNGADFTSEGAALLAQQHMTKYEVGRMYGLSELDKVGLQSLYGAPLHHDRPAVETDASLGAGAIAGIACGSVLFVAFVAWRYSRKDTEYVPLLL